MATSSTMSYETFAGGGCHPDRHPPDADPRIDPVDDPTVNTEPTVPDRNAAARELLANIKRKLPEVDELLATLASWEEDSVYRYYHQSFKVYGLQTAIEQARKLFERPHPRAPD
jgi:hypothetical protein